MRSLTRRQTLAFSAALAGTASTALAACSAQTSGSASDAGTAAADANATKKQIRLLATSDLHGKLLPWDYPTDKESDAGSLAQLATAIHELRDENTILIDAGDTIQGNMTEKFLDEDVHPMIWALNELGYDVGVTGNHEYNFGMDVVRKTVSDFSGTVLCGNVRDENGDPVADGYTIVDKGGVRVGLVGMVTPNIVVWDKRNLEGCTVTNPIDETRKIVDKIAGECDVLVGVMHMGLENQLDVPGSGAIDIANACPELDVIVAAHTHELVEGDEVNGVLVVENEYQAKTMANVVLDLERDGDRWKVTGRTSTPVKAVDYEPDADLCALMADYDARAKEIAREVIGTLVGEPLSSQTEIEGMPSTAVEDTAILDFVNDVQLHYSGAKVSMTASGAKDVEIPTGDIRRCDISILYPYVNTLYTLQFTGAQLKGFLEHTAGYYKKYEPGDLTLGFEPDSEVYSLYQCQGVTYGIDISREVGSRVVDLAWPDGTPVSDDETFVVAGNNYIASRIQSPGVIYEEGADLPTVKEIDVCSNIGGIFEMIERYIADVEKGEMRPTCNESWKIEGCGWDPTLHEQAVELVAAGKIDLGKGMADRTKLIDKVVTEKDLAEAQG